jgi:hypothetical protein
MRGLRTDQRVILAVIAAMSAAGFIVWLLS